MFTIIICQQSVYRSISPAVVRVLIFYSLVSHQFFSSSASPESGLGTSHTSLPGSGHGSTNEQQNEEFYDPEPLQPLGTCKALYPFDGEFFKKRNICRKKVILHCSAPPHLQQQAKVAFQWPKVRNYK
jgi:hypothetical protein